MRRGRVRPRLRALERHLAARVERAFVLVRGRRAVRRAAVALARAAAGASARVARAALALRGDELPVLGRHRELAPLLAARLVLPLLEREAAVDEDRVALLEEAREVVSAHAPDRHVDEGRVLAHVAGLRLEAPRRRDADLADALAAGRLSDL